MNVFLVYKQFKVKRVFNIRNGNDEQQEIELNKTMKATILICICGISFWIDAVCKTKDLEIKWIFDAIDIICNNLCIYLLFNEKIYNILCGLCQNIMTRKFCSRPYDQIVNEESETDVDGFMSA